MNNRESRILKTYEEHGARLVDAHGVLTGTKAVVPPDTVLMFLSEPGYCMLIRAGRRVASNFFENKEGLIQFFKSGGNRKNYKHVSDILKRTHFPGQEYLDTYLEFKDPVSKRLGFIKKLPLTRREIIYNHLYNKEQTPTYAETVGPSVYGQRLKLSTILKRRGPGVYIISSCRVSPYQLKLPQNKLPVNVPHPSSWPYTQPVPRPRRGKIATLIRSIPKSSPRPDVKKILKLKHPASRNYGILSEMSALKKYYTPRPIDNKIKNVLNHMTRENPVNIRDTLKIASNNTINPANFNKTKKYIAPLPANTDPKLFQFTLGILSNKSKIGLVFKKFTLREKAEFAAYPSRRGHIIYKFLKRINFA
jgi:hypothetical protein